MDQKQVSLRMDVELHRQLLKESKKLNKSLTQHILDSVCQRGDIYTTNLHHKIQLHFNLTYLGDLLTMGDHLSFNGLYDNMVQAIKNGYEVVIERQYTNAIPTHLITFTNIDELESWKTRILNVAH